MTGKIILLFIFLYFVIVGSGCVTKNMPGYIETAEMSRDACSKRASEYFMESEAKIEKIKDEARECKIKLKKLSDKTGIEP